MKTNHQVVICHAVYHVLTRQWMNFSPPAQVLGMLTVVQSVMSTRWQHVVHVMGNPWVTKGL